MAKQSKKILHIGCGMSKKPGSIGIDINPKSHADIVHDLDKFPYPFPKNHFDQIIAEHILEHLENLSRVMEELHKISKNGARIYISSCHFSSVDAFTDPTHKHFITSRTFDYYIPGTDLSKFNYSNVIFKKIKTWVGPQTPNPFLKPLLWLINKYLIYYEKRFAFIFPVGNISFELEVVKKK